MNKDVLDLIDSDYNAPTIPVTHDAGPLGILPKLSSRQVKLTSRLAQLDKNQGPAKAIAWLESAIGTAIDTGTPDVVWRASGLRRSGMIAELYWPRLSTRLAFGLATPLAHAVVDRLLGFQRLPEEERLPVSPVEWGILTYVVAESLDRLFKLPAGPLGPWDAAIERVGPDPFDIEGLGRVITLRWPITIGSIQGVLRLWLPETLIARWLISEPPPLSLADPELSKRTEMLTSGWRAEVGSLLGPRGLKTIRVGGVLPLSHAVLSGTPSSPVGPVALVLDVHESGGRFQILTKAVPQSGGAMLLVVAPIRHETRPREGIALPPIESREKPEATGDVPVTLVVELGRVNLTLSRLADLKPGDVVELGRHSREPVELTSGGRLVARGELVQIDTELGVRITNVFL